MVAAITPSPPLGAERVGVRWGTPRFPEVSPTSPHPLRPKGRRGFYRAAAMLVATFALTGCKAIPQIAGVLSGATVGAATGSPALGFAVGIGTDAAVNAGVRWYGRSRSNAEQDAIADAAAPLGVGQRQDWRISHFFPIGNEHGELWVVREIPTPLVLCKQIVFSVDEGEGEKLKRHWYTAALCHNDERWKWASAEPAVQRWGFLQ